MKINIMIDDKYNGPEPTGEIGSFDLYKHALVTPSYADLGIDLPTMLEDMCMCSEVVPPPDPTDVDGWWRALKKVIRQEIEIAIYFEHQRLIKLNEDFYGPAHRDEDVPFV